MRRLLTHNTYPLLLALLFLLQWVVLAIEPLDRHDWMLENALVVVIVLFLVLTRSSFPLSRISYTLIFIFLLLHEVGAHYTYAMVPYDEWSRAITGASFNDFLGWERNNFDRMVHFSYGLLLAYPIREAYFRLTSAEGFWGYFFPLDVTMSTSMIFELIEWGAAEFFGGELGQAYLGTQGDIWDAHKDMALASLGALVAMLITLGLNVYLQKDFSREWADRFRVKHDQTMGEDEIARLWKDKRGS